MAATPAVQAPAKAAPAGKPLGQRLIDAGLITQPQLELALREQRRQGKLLGEVLAQLGFVSAEVLTSSLAAESHTRVVDVRSVVVDPQALRLVSHDLARRHRALPLSRDGDVLAVVLSDSLNVVAIDALERASGLRVEIATAPEADIVDAIARHYTQGGSIPEIVDDLMRNGIGAGTEDDAAASGMVRLVNEIITLAINARATDIHIEPEDRIVRVRMRVDGVLRQEQLIPPQLGPALAARLKIVAGLNVTEKRVPQDGRLRFTLGRREVDLRASTLPTQYGESVVLRLLESGNGGLRFDRLGIREADSRRLVESASRSHGMVLVTGPTGSGKTTTLYSLLAQIDNLQKSVFTLEDPIEYAMPLVRQTQIRPDVGLTFASGLRALLRQDPDVILVGEIRDTETAQLAVRAALTGHLVFSTLHTNDAVGAIARLADMGVERYLLTSALSAVVGQRLLRRICPDCRAEVADLPAEIERYADLLGAITPMKLYAGRGCPACRGTGYRGRLAVYEVLIVDDSFHDAILGGAGHAELTRLAWQSGTLPLLQDGVEKACAGQTTLEEVARVLR
ncbi:MAG: GspE/PulE family protein [Gammaproteobacteria bacterium]